ncbi:MAG: hypothetical protein ABSG80_10800 [Verrucomicrobiota bacterium]|jgi:hypothetical protein
MTDDVMQAVMTTWVAKGLPARLDVTATAKLLGFAENDIQIPVVVEACTNLANPIWSPAANQYPYRRLV